MSHAALRCQLDDALSSHESDSFEEFHLESVQAELIGGDASAVYDSTSATLASLASIYGISSPSSRTNYSTSLSINEAS